MNRSTNKPNPFFKNLVILLISSFAFFVILMLIAAFLLKRIPHFENYYSSVSWIITAFLALFVAFIANRLKSSSDYISLISSGIIGLVFSVISLFCGVSGESFPLVFARFILFVFLTCFISFCFLKSKKGRRKVKKFKFSK